MGMARAQRDSGAVVATAVEYLQPRLGLRPRVLLILGSGLGGLAEEVEAPVRFPYAAIPGFAASTVAGHAGVLAGGRLRGVPVLVMQGRFHIYEGNSTAAVELPVRAAALLGAEILVVTAAAGAVNRAYLPGEVMIVRDHVDLLWREPSPWLATAASAPTGLAAAYDDGLQSLAAEAAAEAAVPVHHGVYGALLGPSYETPAEIRMLERCGIDAVGMSTVPEALAARAAGLRVLGSCLISNMAAGTTGQPLDHAEVVAAGKLAGGRLAAVVKGVLDRLRQESAEQSSTRRPVGR